MKLGTLLLALPLSAPASEAFRDLPVKAIPERSTITFQKDLLLPANFEETEISASHDLRCFARVKPVSNRGRLIRRGSIFYVTGAGESPASLTFASRRNAVIDFLCAPRMDTVTGGEAMSFYPRYAERTLMNFDLSIRRFESMFGNLFRVEYSDPIEIEPNARTLERSAPPAAAPAPSRVPETPARPAPPLRINRST